MKRFNLETPVKSSHPVAAKQILHEPMDMWDPPVSDSETRESWEAGTGVRRSGEKPGNGEKSTRGRRRSRNIWSTREITGHHT